MWVNGGRFSHTHWKQTHGLQSVYKCTYTHIYTLTLTHTYTLIESYLIATAIGLH